MNAQENNACLDWNGIVVGRLKFKAQQTVQRRDKVLLVRTVDGMIRGLYWPNPKDSPKSFPVQIPNSMMRPNSQLHQ